MPEVENGPSTKFWSVYCPTGTTTVSYHHLKLPTKEKHDLKLP